MSRNPRIRNWSERLTQLSLEELRRERDYWQARLPFLGHPQARKEAAKRIRDIESEVASRGE